MHIGKYFDNCRCALAAFNAFYTSKRNKDVSSLGFAEALLIAYNTKNKFRLSMRKLYGKSDADDPDDPGDEEEFEVLS